MKIIGCSKIDGKVVMVLKGDSSLLVNRKPFFVPDWSDDIRMVPCEVLRVSRLGKHISSAFAQRYFDAVAPGLNMCAWDRVAEHDAVRGWAFDYSMVVGSFLPVDTPVWESMNVSCGVVSREEAISLVSDVMTIRQGDLIFIDRDVAPRKLVREEVIMDHALGQETLYCKIK